MSGIPRRALRAGGVVAAAALVLTGCLQNPNAGGGEGGAGGGASVVDGGSADGDKKVTILGAFGGDEEKNFVASLAEFEQSSGIDVQYTADTDFTTTVKQKVNSGDSPDIGLFPQPGGLIEFAAQNKIAPIDSYLDYDKLQGTLLPGFLDASRYKGRVYGAPMRNAVKSVVWYPKAAYDEAGLPKDPATIQELRTNVADKIAASGITPWCIGWESDQATGWVGTDWVEELMLRMHGPSVYDDWTAHRIPFNDERVVAAFDEAAKFNKDPEMVLGGPRGVLNTAFGDAMTPAFSNPPKCMLHRQGNFATTFYPKNVQADLDNQVGIYVFPKFEGGYDGASILGGGDLAGLFNGNDEDAKKVMEFITSDKFGAPWAKAGGWLSPHKTFDVSNYPNETTRKIADIANKASVLRFDGSDLMPKSIGSDVFWKEMVKWANGQSSQQTVDNIEAAWPKS
jgi:alpha-glucoside transport system substrate-binding protein